MKSGEKKIPDVSIPEVTVLRRENSASLNFVQALRLQPFETDRHKSVSRLLTDRTR